MFYIVLIIFDMVSSIDLFFKFLYLISLVISVYHNKLIYFLEPCFVCILFLPLYYQWNVFHNVFLWMNYLLLTYFPMMLFMNISHDTLYLQYIFVYVRFYCISFLHWLTLKNIMEIYSKCIVLDSMALFKNGKSRKCPKTF